MPEGYCVKERKKVEIKDPKQVTMKNGRPAIQGVCPDCGTKIFKIVKKFFNFVNFLAGGGTRWGASPSPGCRAEPRHQAARISESRGSRILPTDPQMASGALTREQDVREAYSAHGSELYGFAVRSLGDAGLAEEAVQETFVRAWRAGERFDPQIGSLRTWLFAILRNVVIDLGRARAARPGVAEGGIEPSVEPLGEVLLSWQVEEALRRIGDDHRRVIVETFYRGRPYAEIAEELGVPEGTVKSRVYYGLRALRVALEETGYDG